MAIYEGLENLLETFYLQITFEEESARQIVLGVTLTHLVQDEHPLLGGGHWVVGAIFNSFDGDVFISYSCQTSCG